MAAASPCELNKEPKLPNEFLRNEMNRSKTFDHKSWQNTEEEKMDYAKAGFFYTGKDKIIKCPYCSLEIKVMSKPEPAVRKMLPLLHAWHASNCEFITDKVRGKNNSHYDAVPSPTVPSMVQTSEEYQIPGFETKPKNLTLSRVVEGQTQTYNLQSKNDRLRTFTNFPINDRPPIQKLSEAGFFYNPLDTALDRVTCFWCNGSLEEWDPTDDPLIEHAKYYPGCSFLRLVKGTNFIICVRLNMNNNERERAQRLNYFGSGRILAPGYTTYNNVATRMMSFSQRSNRREFSKLGFHEVSDIPVCMMCYSCGLLLDINTPSENVRSMHMNYSQNCELLNVDAQSPTEGGEGVLLLTELQHTFQVANQ